MELVAEPGRTKLTGLDANSVRMAFEGSESRQKLGNGPSKGRLEIPKPFLTSARNTYLDLYIDRTMWSAGDCAAAQWTLGVEHSDKKQDAMPLILCTRTRPTGTLQIPGAEDPLRKPV